MKTIGGAILARFLGRLTELLAAPGASNHWLWLCMLAAVARLAKYLQVVGGKQKLDVFAWPGVFEVMHLQVILRPAQGAGGIDSTLLAELWPSVGVVPLASRIQNIVRPTFRLPITRPRAIEAHAIAHRFKGWPKRLPALKAKAFPSAFYVDDPGLSPARSRTELGRVAAGPELLVALHACFLRHGRDRSIGSNQLEAKSEPQ